MSGFDPYHKWLGIPAKDQPPNHYRLLGLELFEPDSDVISSAADSRMGHIRSFQAGRHSALSQRILNELAAARLCLLNPERKAQYDAALRTELSGQAACEAAGFAQPVPVVVPAMPIPVSGPAPEPLAAATLPAPPRWGSAPRLRGLPSLGPGGGRARRGPARWVWRERLLLRWCCCWRPGPAASPRRRGQTSALRR